MFNIYVPTLSLEWILSHVFEQTNTHLIYILMLKKFMAHLFKHLAKAQSLVLFGHISSWRKHVVLSTLPEPFVQSYHACQIPTNEKSKEG